MIGRIMYKFDKDIEMTSSQKQAALNIINSEVKFTYNDKIICEVYPMELDYCKEFTGREYQEVLTEMLTNISPNIDEAIREIFKEFNEPYSEESIPGMVAYAVQEKYLLV